MTEFITTLSAAIWQILGSFIIIKGLLFFVGSWLTSISILSLKRRALSDEEVGDGFGFALVSGLIVIALDTIVWGLPYVAGWFISEGAQGTTPLQNLASSLQVFLIQIRDLVFWLTKFLTASLFVLSCLSIVQFVLHNPIEKVLEMRPIATAPDITRTNKDADKTYRNRFLFLVIIGICCAIYWAIFCWQSYNNYGKNIQQTETTAYSAVVSVL